MILPDYSHASPRGASPWSIPAAVQLAARITGGNSAAAVLDLYRPGGPAVTR